MLTILNTEMYQMFFLKKAINELLKEGNDNIIESIKQDHIKGCNYINSIKIPLTFPMYVLNYINTISKEKEYTYNFIGTMTKKRSWINKYSNNSIIKSSGYGRNPKTKYELDKNYYNVMSKSKFTFTPTGDCPWSYRFFEAIMCFSIPILENNSNDIYAKDYFFLYDNDEHIYDKGKATENYNKLINSNHFLKNIPELENLFQVIH